jgi:hypothetical protein
MGVNVCPQRDGGIVVILDVVILVFVVIIVVASTAGIIVVDDVGPESEMDFESGETVPVLQETESGILCLVFMKGVIEVIFILGFCLDFLEDKDSVSDDDERLLGNSNFC